MGIVVCPHVRIFFSIYHHNWNMIPFSKPQVIQSDWPELDDMIASPQMSRAFSFTADGNNQLQKHCTSIAVANGIVTNLCVVGGAPRYWSTAGEFLSPSALQHPTTARPDDRVTFHSPNNHSHRPPLLYLPPQSKSLILLTRRNETELRKYQIN